MNPLVSRRSTEQFARLLDGGGPEASGAVTGPLALVERLRAVAPALAATADPTPAFRTALRTRLLAVAAVPTPVPTTNRRQAAARWSRGRAVQRRLGVTAGALAGVIVLTGIGVAGSRSLPGAPLYGVKRGAEGIQLALAGGGVAAGTRELQFARVRLREVVALATGAEEVSIGSVVPTGPIAADRVAFGGPVTDRIRAGLADMDSETRSGYRLLADAYQRTGRAELPRRLAAFGAAQQRGLTGVLPNLPAGTRAQAQASLALVTVIAANAGTLLQPRPCPAGCPPAPGRSVSPSGGTPTGPAGTQRPAPAQRSPATRVPTAGAPATRAPSQPPAGRHGSPRSPAPAGSGRPPGTLPTLPPLPPPGPRAPLPPPAPLSHAPLSPLPIPSVRPPSVPVPVPLPTQLPTVPPLLPCGQPRIGPTATSRLDPSAVRRLRELLWREPYGCAGAGTTV